VSNIKGIAVILKNFRLQSDKATSNR